MKENIIIRLERETEYQEVENLVRVVVDLQ